MMKLLFLVNVFFQLFVHKCYSQNWYDQCNERDVSITDGRGFPGTTEDATFDIGTNNGQCDGIRFDSPGIWWTIEGIGDIIRASSCNARTDIKVKIAVFTGPDCNNLRCIGGSNEPDYECNIFNDDKDHWKVSTSYDFYTHENQKYYILVMANDPSTTGKFWISFRHPNIPQNNECKNAIGPIPRDQTRIVGTSIDATYEYLHDNTYHNVGFCSNINGYYPGVWYQIFGTGKPITLKACSWGNYDGFQFSVYKGRTCETMECIPSDGTTLQQGIIPSGNDIGQCTFGNLKEERFQSTFTFNTIDRSRYYILLHFDDSQLPPFTENFRFYVDDGENGMAGSGGITGLQFATGLRGSSGDGILYNSEDEDYFLN